MRALATSIIPAATGHVRPATRLLEPASTAPFVPKNQIRNAQARLVRRHHLKVGDAIIETQDIWERRHGQDHVVGESI